MRNGLVYRNDWFPSLFNGFDRMFDDVRFNAATPATFGAPANIEETETHFLISLDAPGVRREDIKVEVDQDLLKISGQREASATDKKRVTHHAERAFGRFERSFRLGEEADLDKIEAQFTDGVLHVAIPKRETAKPRRIEIKVN